MNECFYFRVIKNWVNAIASLVLHTRELKEDNGKTKTKRLGFSSTESVRAVRLESSGQSSGRRGLMVRMICGIGNF